MCVCDYGVHVYMLHTCMWYAWSDVGVGVYV